MNICTGCNGVIGSDCFNPQECEQIAMKQLMQEVQHEEAVEHIKNCEQCQKELSI